ncbi:M28 family peptidase [Candidatus Bipolaricaulota bacterium]|nr:M28 family peptidase [Candidatus Bipolaricaulota bacterium]
MDREICRTLLGELWGSDAPGKVIRALTGFGGRFGGTQEEAQAAQFIAQKMLEYGLEEVHLESFPIQGWKRGPATLKTISPQRREFPAIALPYSPASQVEGELVSVNQGLPEQFQEVDVKGKIVMASSDTPDHYPRWVHREEKYSLAVEQGAIGFVFVNHYPGCLPVTGSLRSGKTAELPGVGVSRETGWALERMLVQGPVSLELEVQAEAVPASSQNVVGYLNADSQLGEIVVCAHYDGHDIAQGALDNGAGVTVLLELARVLGPLRDRFPRRITFIAFGAEEIGLIGSQVYVRDHELSDVIAVLNLDGAGRARNMRAVVNGFSQLGQLIADTASSLGARVTVDPRLSIASDHWPFVEQGIPGCQFSPDTGRGRGWGHTPADTLDKVDVRDIRENASLLALLILRLAEGKTIIPRTDPRQIAQRVRAQGLERLVNWIRL